MLHNNRAIERKEGRRESKRGVRMNMIGRSKEGRKGTWAVTQTDRDSLLRRSFGYASVGACQVGKRLYNHPNFNILVDDGSTNRFTRSN